MNNEVYIDGVNVAECIELHIKEGYAGNCRITNGCCKHNPNCYFKQLQRAKAELEQYKKSKQASYESMQNEWNKAVNELRDVKAENEEIKENNQWYDSVTKALQAENEKLKKSLKRIQELSKCRIENLVILEECNEALK